MALENVSPLTVERLQAYIRSVVAREREPVNVPPFTLFIHPSDDSTFFNYAIPDAPAGAYLHEPLAVLRAEFRRRGRHARFEFIEEYAPDLPAALRAGGFAEESRLHLMTCTRATYRPAPQIHGLAVVTLDRGAPLDAVREHLDVNSRGFNPAAEPATAAAAEAFRRGLEESRAFTAYLDGQAAGAGMFTAPLDGLTELVGIATLEQFRRRGVATALTAQAARAAFDRAAGTVFLSAADEQAGRVYERVGFRPFATMLAYAEAP
jgi:ribosomal protein S18 acetylase RimI-like enzyme